MTLPGTGGTWSEAEGEDGHGGTNVEPGYFLNSGKVPHTAKYAPWRITAAIAVDSAEKAAELESYFKSHSGRVFAAKHF